MNETRPKNLNLFTIYFPLPAVVSILHRLSGFILFFTVPIFLCVLQYSLTETGFLHLQQWREIIWVKGLIWLLLIPFCFHLVAGIRHLLSDIQLGVSLQGGRLSSLLTIIFSLILIILLGIWLW